MKNISKKITILTGIVLLAITAIAIVANKNAILEANSKIQEKSDPNDITVNIQYVQNTVGRPSSGILKSCPKSACDINESFEVSSTLEDKVTDFRGWTPDPNYTKDYLICDINEDTCDLSSITPNATNVIFLYPVVKYKDFTITFNKNTAAEISYTSHTCHEIVYNLHCGMDLPTITPGTNQVVAGWGTSATATTNLLDPGAHYVHPTYTDAILYAITKAGFTVSFDSNGGTGSKDSVVVESGGSYTLPANPFTPPTNKVFDKWEVTPEGGNSVDKNPNDTITVSANTTVKAVWKNQTYTITFNAGGGSGTMSSTSVSAASEYTLPSCTFTAPNGKTFSKWKIGNTEYEVGAKVVINANTTVTAVWEEATVIVTFNENISETGETISETRVVAIGSKLTDIPEDPEREGYKFVGWYTDKNGTKKFDFSKPITKDTSLYAKWAEIGSEFKFTKVPVEPVDVEDEQISFEINLDLDLFVQGTYKVFVDNKLLEEEKDYELTSGSTIITLTDSYASTLSSGKHTLKVEYDGESKTTEFAVAGGSGSHDIDPEDGENDGSGSSGDEYGTVDNPETGAKYILIVPLVIALVIMLKEIKKRNNTI